LICRGSEDKPLLQIKQKKGEKPPAQLFRETGQKKRKLQKKNFLENKSASRGLYEQDFGGKAGKNGGGCHYNRVHQSSKR